MRKRVTATAEPPEDRRGDRQFITALHRGLDLLRAFRPADHAGLSNRDLSERTGLPNSTISRLTYTLMQLDYLVYDDSTGRYRLGVPVLGLGYACLGGMQIVETAQVYMQKLVDQCGDGVLLALGGRDDMAMTYMATARAPSMVSLQLSVGSRISLARSAMGRAWLAGLEPEQRGPILSQIEARYGEDYPRIREGIDAAEQQIAERGFYLNLREWKSDVHSIAVPYRSPRSDTPLLAFNLGGPAFLLPEERLVDDLGPRLVDMVRRVSRAGR